MSTASELSKLKSPKIVMREGAKPLSPKEADYLRAVLIVKIIGRWDASTNDRLHDISVMDLHDWLHQAIYQETNSKD